MKFTKKQRENMPLCIIGRSNHAWKKGSEKFGQCGICAYCGYDSFDDVHRSVAK